MLSNSYFSTTFFQSGYLSIPTTTIISTSPFKTDSSSQLKTDSLSPFKTDSSSPLKTDSSSAIPLTTSNRTVESTPPVSSITITSILSSLSLSSVTITQNASNTGNSMTIIIAAASSGFLLIAFGLILATLIVIICQAKRKKRESYSVSSEIDDAFNNPTYGTKNILTVTADNHIRAVNPVYEGKK